MMVWTRSRKAAAFTLLLSSALLIVPAAASADVLAGGQFKSAFSAFLSGPALVGDFQVVTEDGKTYLEFGAGFKAKSAPDLKVFLSQRAPEAVTGTNATESAVRLGLLMGFEGAQRYAIPAGTDLSDFSTVIVHCEQYSKLWGAGRLE